jgi:hypothetical protein
LFLRKADGLTRIPEIAQRGIRRFNRVVVIMSGFGAGWKREDHDLALAAPSGAPASSLHESIHGRHFSEKTVCGDVQSHFHHLSGNQNGIGVVVVLTTAKELECPVLDSLAILGKKARVEQQNLAVRWRVSAERLR